MRIGVGLIFFCFPFLVRLANAQNDIKKNSLSEIAREERVSSKNDTIRALRNLFQRKRRALELKRVL
jgi:hypothetical protein